MSKQATQRVVGLTKDAGFQIGVRRTVDVSPQCAWDILTSNDAVNIWLGDVGELRLEPGASFRTGNGTTGTFRIVKPGSHVRLAWQPPHWSNESTLQVRVLPRPTQGRATVSFHQEKLRDTGQRQQMHRHWLQVLDQLEGLFSTSEE